MAVKVLDLLPRQRRQIMAAWRECQLLSRINHPSIVRVVTFYTAQVNSRQQATEPV